MSMDRGTHPCVGLTARGTNESSAAVVTKGSQLLAASHNGLALGALIFGFSDLAAVLLFADVGGLLALILELLEQGIANVGESLSFFRCWLAGEVVVEPRHVCHHRAR